jgi:hypothetical protein
MHLGILPSVPNIGLPIEEDHQSSFIEYAESLGRLSVMLVYLRQTVGKIVKTVVDTVTEGKLHQFLVRKDNFHLPEKRLPQALGIVGKEEAAVGEVSSKPLHLLIGEFYIAMTGHKQEGIRE